MPFIETSPEVLTFKEEGDKAMKAMIKVYCERGYEMREETIDGQHVLVCSEDCGSSRRGGSDCPNAGAIFAVPTIELSKLTLKKEDERS